MQPRFNIYYKEYGSSLCELWSATDTTRAFNRVSKRIRSPRKISSPLNVSLQSFRPFCSNNILRQIRFPSFLLYSFSSPPRERKARRKCNELTQLLYKYIREGAGYWERAKIGNERNEKSFVMKSWIEQTFFHEKRITGFRISWRFGSFAPRD